MARSKKRIREILALNMVRLRKDRDWSQEVLAHECGLNRTYIGDVERQARNISIDNVEKLARALDVEPWQLLKP